MPQAVDCQSRVRALEPASVRSTHSSPVRSPGHTPAFAVGCLVLCHACPPSLPHPIANKHQAPGGKPGLVVCLCACPSRSHGRVSGPGCGSLRGSGKRVPGTACRRRARRVRRSEWPQKQTGVTQSQTSREGASFEYRFLFNDC